MKIISLQKAIKNIKVSFDDGQNVYLDYKTVVDFGLRKNDEIEEEKLKWILEKNARMKCLDSAFFFLSRRLHSNKELEQKLVKKKYDHDLILSILRELREKKYLDDKKFAELYVIERSSIKKIGINKLRVELMKKGINRNIIDDALSNLSDENMLEDAVLLAEKKLRTLSEKNLDKAKIKLKLYNFLMLRGYRTDTINTVFSKINLNDF